MVQTSVELLYDSSIQTLLSKWCFEFLLGLLSPIPLTPASAKGFLLLTRSQPPLFTLLPLPSFIYPPNLRQDAPGPDCTGFEGLLRVPIATGPPGEVGQSVPLGF